MERKSLREALSEWTDWDGAGLELGICLGLMPLQSGWGRSKHVFWSQNLIGDALYKMLDDLIAIDILERRDEPDRQYRWNPAFKGSWE